MMFWKEDSILSIMNTRELVYTEDFHKYMRTEETEKPAHIIATCSNCHETVIERLEDGREISYECSCEKQAKIEKKLNKFKELSINDRNSGEDKFKNAVVKTAEERILYKKIQNYVQNFDEILKINDGLFFIGKCGTGKTFLANCICNYLAEHNHTVLSFNLSSYLRALREDFNSENEFLKAAKEVDMLFIDDLGSEKLSEEWGKEKVFSLIDTRYRAGKPIVITSNLDKEELKEFLEYKKSNKILDRIREMTKVFYFTWQSKRKQKDKAFWEEIA